MSNNRKMLEIEIKKAKIRVQQEKLDETISEIADEKFILELLNPEVDEVKAQLDEIKAKYDKLLSKRGELKCTINANERRAGQIRLEIQYLNRPSSKPVSFSLVDGN